MSNTSSVRSDRELIGYIWHRDRWYGLLRCQKKMLVDGAVPYTIYLPISPEGDEASPSLECPLMAYTRDNPPPVYAENNPFNDWLSV